MALTQHSFTKTSGGQLAQQMDEKMDPKDYDGGKLQQVPEATNHHGDEATELNPPVGVSAGGKRKTGKNSRRAGKRRTRKGKNRTRKGKNRTQKKNKRSKTSKK
jgi:hypothetical protein